MKLISIKIKNSHFAEFYQNGTGLYCPELSIVGIFLHYTFAITA